MSVFKHGYEHTTVSQSTLISSTACMYYGVLVVNATTAGVKVQIFDATATATGTLIDTVTVAAGTLANASRFFEGGVAMHKGIYASAVVATTAADSIVVFYGGK